MSLFTTNPQQGHQKLISLSKISIYLMVTLVLDMHNIGTMQWLASAIYEQVSHIFSYFCVQKSSVRSKAWCPGVLLLGLG